MAQGVGFLLLRRVTPPPQPAALADLRFAHSSPLLRGARVGFESCLSKMAEGVGFLRPRRVTPPPQPAALADVRFAHSSPLLRGARVGFKSCLSNMAEGVGFEPTSLSGYGFQDRRLRPLGHPSVCNWGPVRQNEMGPPMPPDPRQPQLKPDGCRFASLGDAKHSSIFC
jgi:hypothetical protein